MNHMAPRWNNRIFKHTNGHGPTYALHECYYDEDGKTGRATVATTIAMSDWGMEQSYRPLQ